MKLPKPCLSGFALKRIAMVSMIVDHVGGFLLKPFYMGHYAAVTSEAEAVLSRRWFYLIQTCSAIGSVAFPLFCFLIAEGFVHTRSRRDYVRRILLFALISELPFNLVHHSELFYPALQNVMFTLTLGVLTLWALSYAEERYFGKRLLLYRIGITLLGMALAFAVRGEYVFLGVLAMVLFYELRNREKLRYLAFIPLVVPSLWFLAAAPAVYLYNGTRGKGSRNFFYVFYPAHFLVLYALVLLCRLA